MIGVLVFSIVTVALFLLLRNQQKEIATVLCIAAAVLLFLYTIGNVSDAIVYLRETANVAGVSEEVGVLVKALGIAAAVQITADICREAGESVVAGQVELAGKAEILVLSLPLLSQLLSLIQGLLS